MSDATLNSLGRVLHKRKLLEYDFSVKAPVTAYCCLVFYLFFHCFFFLFFSFFFFSLFFLFFHFYLLIFFYFTFIQFTYLFILNLLQILFFFILSNVFCSFFCSFVCFVQHLVCTMSELHEFPCKKIKGPLTDEFTSNSQTKGERVGKL